MENNKLIKISIITIIVVVVIVAVVLVKNKDNQGVNVPEEAAMNEEVIDESDNDYSEDTIENFEEYEEVDSTLDSSTSKKKTSNKTKSKKKKANTSVDTDEPVKDEPIRSTKNDKTNETEIILND